MRSRAGFDDCNTPSCPRYPLYKKTLRGRALYNMLKELVKFKVLGLSEKYYPLLGFLKDFAQRYDLRAERHQFKFVINLLNFKYCGWCYTLRNIISDGLYGCLPFIRECKENHRGTYNVDATLHHDRDSMDIKVQHSNRCIDGKFCKISCLRLHIQQSFSL